MASGKQWQYAQSCFGKVAGNALEAVIMTMLAGVS